MSKETTTAILGVFIAVLPFLGFPQAWRNVFFIVSGIAIVILGLLLRADHLHRMSTGTQGVPKRLSRKPVPDMLDTATSSEPVISGDVHR